MQNKPLITIGMPVYNGGKHIRRALNSILSQTYRDFELIISDNASTDETSTICREYAVNDGRIRYVRQPANRGAMANFRFVLQEANSKFFMWSAADDIRSPDFLAANLSFLQSHPEYVASTSPVRFSGGRFDERKMGDASLDDDDRFDRISKPFNTSHANGRFYSLFRREAVVTWPHLDDAEFLGSDWTLPTHLASLGKLHRHEDGWVELGIKGMSNRPELFAFYRKRRIEWLLPYYRVMLDAMHHLRKAPMRKRASLLWKLLRINQYTARVQYRAHRELRACAAERKQAP